MNILTEIRDPETGYRLRVDTDDQIAFLVTDCCGATATGTESGIACRACYEDCDPIIGAVIYALPGCRSVVYLAEGEDLPEEIFAEVMAVVTAAA